MGNFQMTETKIAMTIATPILPIIEKGKPGEQGLPNRQPTQPTKADHALTEKVMQVLNLDHLLGKGDIAHLHATVKDGRATLRGHVKRAVSKTQAGAAVQAIPGITAVTNQLVADDELTIAVAQALGNDPQTQHEHIQVNVQHGVVYLGGAIARPQIRAVAGQKAASIGQVRGIINVIQTPGIAIESDEEQFVQPAIASEIYATDGQVGRVQQVIMNPQNRRVTAVVVASHTVLPQALDGASSSSGRQPAPQRVLIPMSTLRCAPSGALFLKIKAGEVARFADFNPLSFEPPATDWQPPYPYLPADILFHRHRV
jgi:osmotically-inducible protein OsmY/sporulation protein YlmC with PRC-barrel domain